MFQEQKISDYREARRFHNILWSSIKLAIAFALINYIDYGILKWSPKTGQVAKVQKLPI